jgi:hypothetical protein
LRPGCERRAYFGQCAGDAQPLTFTLCVFCQMTDDPLKEKLKIVQSHTGKAPKALVEGKNNSVKKR